MNDLPDLLEEVAGDARYYDVTERALIGGRRRRRRQRLAVSSAAVALSVAVVIGAFALPREVRHVPAGPPPAAVPSPSLATPTACTMSPLPLPPEYADAPSLVGGGDQTGSLHVGVVTPEGANNDRIVIWNNGSPTLYKTKGAGTEMRDINSRAVAVGWSLVDGVPTGWVLDSSLRRLRGDQVAVNAINEANVIVGRWYNQPAVWRSPSALPERLRLPAEVKEGIAYDIAEDGTIVGELVAGVGSYQAYLWRPDGTGMELVPPPGFTNSRALRIAGDWVVGDGDRGAIRWNIRTGVTERVADVKPNAVNSSGWLAGTRSPLWTGQSHSIAISLQFESAVVSMSGQTPDVVLGGFLMTKDPAAVLWRCR